MKRTLMAMAVLSMAAPVMAAGPSPVDLCKGAIATVMYKDPGIMHGHMDGDQAVIGYTRSDGEAFEMKCKFPKDGVVIWAGKIDGQWGRWRDRTSDSVVTYSTQGNSVTFKENMGGSVIGSKTIDF